MFCAVAAHSGELYLEIYKKPIKPISFKWIDKVPYFIKIFYKKCMHCRRISGKNITNKP